MADDLDEVPIPSTHAIAPAPLTPPDCDLQDFKFMPLDVQRLRDSDLTAEQTPEENWAAVLLWAASWHQVPAASLPNVDQTIAKWAGYVARGKVDRQWEIVRTGAMRGFILCSDGRYYHPVVAEKAREAWLSKLRNRWMTECKRIRKHNERHGLSLATPEFEPWLSDGCRIGHPLPVACDTDPLSPRQAGETPSKGQGHRHGQGYGQGSIQEPAGDSPPPAGGGFLAPPDEGCQTLGDPPPTDLPDDAPKLPPCPHLDVLRLWAEVLPQLPQHDPEQWNDTRRKHLQTRWRETAVTKGWTSKDDGLRYFRKLFVYVGQSRFLTGRAGSGTPGRPPFTIELEWLILPTNWAKVIEGKYHTD